MIGASSRTAGLGQTGTLENQGLRLELNVSDASMRLIDKGTGVVWALGSPQIVLADGRAEPVRPVGGVTQTQETLTYRSDFGLEFRLRLVQDPPAVEYRFIGEFQPSASPRIKEVHLFHNSLAVGPGEANYFAIPHRMGILRRAGGDGDRPASRRLAYSNGYSMAMMGAVQNGSALLVSWDTPEASLLVDDAARPQPRLSAGIALQEPGHPVRLQPLVLVSQVWRRIGSEPAGEIPSGGSMVKQ